MAEIVKENQEQHTGLKLNYYLPVLKDGVKVVKLIINPQEIAEQNQKWSLVLIGYVIGGNPTFKEMLKFVYGVWNFVSTPQVFLHNNGYFIFKFENEEDKAAILQQGPYTFNYRPFILKQWDLEFQMHKESTQIVPMWVMFPNLPIQFWAPGNLGRIASCIGNPICTDKLTTQEQRIAYAKILIEMDISQPLPDSLSLELPDGKYYSQDIEYEWKPMYCQDCLKVGHVTGDCKKRPAEYREPQQNIKKKPTKE
ncbi:PREDICTED: uncharacterized protein LOC109234641 [Nicotiana attenuata]|uniref:uncharacterized protein LOC109234641 n=1 Tax=Nicotiana attenuata TaxID=49451 RepID=UPI0009054E59|nr:PREDICTED: uncharacterized protein LOC109234641 [Nicotiana attenuata]